MIQIMFEKFNVNSFYLALQQNNASINEIVKSKGIKIAKARDTVEEVEEIYHDAVEEEGNTEEDSKEEEKEENAESKREVTKYPGVNRRRQTSTRAGNTDDIMRKNDGDKSQTSQ